MKTVLIAMTLCVVVWSDSLTLSVSPMLTEEETSLETANPVAVEPMDLANTHSIDAQAVVADSVNPQTIQVSTPEKTVENGKKCLSELVSMTGSNVMLQVADISTLDEWIEAYKRTSVLNKAPAIMPGIRMIAELRSIKYAEENLRLYAAMGYNSVLITINSDEETPAKLMELALLARKHGLSPWLAWSGQDSYDTNAYRSLITIKRQFAAVLPYCVGFIPAWRRTSVHLMGNNAKYLAVLCELAQSIKPDILIVDEVFRRNGSTQNNLVEGASATYISGYGFQTYRPRLTIKMFFRDILKTRRCLGLVVGYSGLYASSRDKHLAWKEALDAKIDVERQFLEAGCIGTITLHGDGSDIGKNIQNTDDIGLFPIQ